MILSVSRRTDVPNYFSDWFLNRLKEGYLYVRNPRNPHQISRISLSPDVLDCIVFWTKNPIGLLKRLDELKPYLYYFQFTLTGYGKEVEPGLPDKKDELLPAFRELSGYIGNERVIWRYDPIFISDRYTKEYHAKAFTKIAEELAGYTKRVVISFVDFYAKLKRNTAGLGIQVISQEEMIVLAKQMADIAAEYGMEIEACAEQTDFSSVGVQKGHCIDGALIERISGRSLTCEKDKNQRAECGCMESVEVGTYHTCKNGCKYCYANDSEERVRESLALYDADSPLLCGAIQPQDKITDRKVKSLFCP